MKSTPKSRIRILIADDHFVVRMGLARALNMERDMLVIAEADNGREAIALYDEHQPDLAILDYRMAGANGDEAASAIIARFPSARLMMLTVCESAAEIRRAVQAGVCAYLPKSIKHSELLQAIRDVAQGHTVFPQEIAEKLARYESEPTLTRREQEVLTLIVGGQSNKEIGSTLQISLGTVKIHTTHVFAKLGVFDRTQATTAALQRGLVPLD